METPKFKVGDRVRIINGKWVGDTGTVVETSICPWLRMDDYNPSRYRTPVTYLDIASGYAECREQEALELIETEAPSPKHTTYTPDGVTISMELEWEIARLLGMVQAFNADHPAIMGQCEKINQMWMGK